MNPRRFLPLIVLLAAAVSALHAAQAPSFDRLSEEDRKALGERFRREVWPLLERGDKDGCVGCHRDGKIVSALRMSGDPDRDFRMLLREGFFLKDDAGSLLARVIDPDRRRRMPPPSKGPAWEEDQVRTLRAFVEAVHQKQKR
jgi:hypothetical protein